jgi:hypothetical protein
MSHMTDVTLSQNATYCVGLWLCSPVDRWPCLVVCVCVCECVYVLKIWPLFYGIFFNMAQLRQEIFFYKRFDNSINSHIL